MHRGLIRAGAAALLAAIAGIAGASGSEAQAQPGAGARTLHGGFSMNPAQKERAGYARMDNSLAGIAEQVAATPKAGLMSRLQASTPEVRYSLRDPLLVPGVLVDIQASGDAAALAQQLQQLGAEHTSHFSNLVSAFVPVDQLKTVAALPGVRFMRASRAFTRTGSITSQGDFIQHSDLVRASSLVPGLTGAGVSVGVLSDSFACTSAIKSYADDVASGDLPSGVQVLEEYNAASAGVAGATTPCDGATDEGRAIAQVVYDVAPGVKLKFHTGSNGEADFANGILALAGAGANIITEDAGYFDEPIFQDGVVAQAVDQVKAQGVAYFSAAGNNGRQSYEADYKDSGTVGNAGTDNAGEKLMAFTSLDGKTTQNWLPFSVPTGFQEQSVQILEWDQPYVTGAPNSGGATSSLDICLTDNTGVVLPGGCSGPNPVGADPVSITGFFTDSTTAAYGLQVGVVGSANPHHIKIVFQDQGKGSQADPAFATNSPTVQGHPGAAGAAAVGASYFAANPVCQPSVYPAYTLEDYSAAGGDPILFDVNGNKLVTPLTRQKPDFVGPDGGNTTFYSEMDGALASSTAQCRNAANTYNFHGTSAAAPHAAGAAALLLQAVPGATPDQIVQALGSTAILGMANASGKVQTAVNFDTGHGFIQADKALAALATRVLSLSPAALGFGNQRVGTVSAPQNVTVTNTGGLAVAISRIAVSGPFIQGNTCPASLASQASCQVLVSAAVTAMGPASGSLTITSNDAQGTDGVALSATGVAPVVSVAPAQVSFGQVVVGSAAQQHAVILGNSGTAPLDISGIAVAGTGFSQSNTCPATLAVGAQCVINVGFSPASAQSYTGLVIINSDGAAGSQTQISLSGQGVQPVAVLSPQSLNFGTVTVGGSTKSSSQGGSGTLQVSLANGGGAPLHISSIAVGDPAFTQTNNCPATLPAGASCAINVDFSPAAAQAYSSQITVISDSAASGDSQVGLSGTGTAPPSGGGGGGAVAPWLLLPGGFALLLRRRKKRA